MQQPKFESNGNSNHQTSSGTVNRFYSPLVLNIAAQEGVSMSEDIREDKLRIRTEMIAKMLLNGDLTVIEAIRGLQNIVKETEELKKMLDNPDAFLYKGKEDE